MTYDIKIDNHKVFTIKEVPPGQLYILKGTVERGSKLKAIHCVRRRTADPFRSLTYFGTKVFSFPSDKVYLVEVIVNSPL